jgi:hypothetical protein
MDVYVLLFWVIARVIRSLADRPNARTVTRSTCEQTPGGPVRSCRSTISPA